MLDAHAHIAPDVTGPQLAALGNTVVFAVTRSIAEARQVARRDDPGIVWGLGVHPGVSAALDDYDEVTFAKALPYFGLVGEVGLDRRGNLTQQRAVLDSILSVCQHEPVLLSLHSTGRAAQLLEALTATPHPGAILHWFTGTVAQIDAAVTLGAHFSVNAAMDPALIAAIPPERLLTETDFPSSRKRTQAKKPGDVQAAENLIADIHDVHARTLVTDNFDRLLARLGPSARIANLRRPR
jgi:TatD DNase family protein